ncbi:MAG: Stk1 family PASTA domain-containing Ser/Thr kinase [Lachnospiraceae bacterium]|nr:Stk1 family PASTA domain-containing Ser/Thr kinase [Lachnospiraceae bacterium]
MEMNEMVIAGRYEIIERIGSGGMSDVFKARDIALSRYVAIKILKADYAEDINFVSKFHSEAQAAASLEHPNIVNIYDVGSDDHVHYIVMEYVSGVTLKTYIEKKGRLTSKEAISVAVQVARGIGAAHEKQIIHRDIKPQNIMISSGGGVKVMDFGIARAATSNTIHTDVMGSVHYSSPEQSRNGFVDYKSDIYSLGIVMYEMVTGRVPYDGDTTVSIAIQHLQDEMVSPKEYAPDLPVSLEKIILKCTQKNQDFRYNSMIELISDLRRAMLEPDVDFVTISTPVSAAKTTIIGEDDLAEIKEKSREMELAKLNDASAQDADASSEDADSAGALDDDEETKLSPRVEKIITVAGIIVAAIILIIVIYLLGNILGAFSGSRKNTKTDENPIIAEDNGDDEEVTSKEILKMIDVKGKTVAEATEMLKNAGFGITVEKTEISEEVEAGIILAQDIEPGSEAEAGYELKVTVSGGEGTFALPNTEGYTQSVAVGILETAGLYYSIEVESSDTVPENTVIRSEPEAGTKVKVGDEVKLVLSQGRKAIIMPDLADKPYDDAVASLEEEGLVIGNVTEEHSSTVEEGCVISQSETAGKTVYSGNSIDLVISIGEETLLYYFKANITLPEEPELVGANIKLTDADGAVLDAWNDVAVSAFPLSIEVDEIETSTGTLTIDWIIENSDGSLSYKQQMRACEFKEMQY